ncbi:MAG TPA: hypothetical protein VFY45_05605, partial [Baekduia sp.]|nr:hypothetical protein [Baekduia sp.]
MRCTALRVAGAVLFVFAATGSVAGRSAQAATLNLNPGSNHYVELSAGSPQGQMWAYWGKLGGTEQGNY